MEITLKFSTCGQCPYVQDVTGGIKYVCGCTKIMVLRPYALDRQVDPNEIASFCPLIGV